MLLKSQGSTKAKQRDSETETSFHSRAEHRHWAWQEQGVSTRAGLQEAITGYKITVELAGEERRQVLEEGVAWQPGW